MNLPPLPEPASFFEVETTLADGTLIPDRRNYYTDDQMRERDVQIWNLARQRALEEAAQKCIALTGNRWVTREAALECADEIRSLIK